MLNLYTFWCTFCPHEGLERPFLNSLLKIIKHVCLSAIFGVQYFKTHVRLSIPWTQDLYTEIKNIDIIP